MVMPVQNIDFGAILLKNRNVQLDGNLKRDMTDLMDKIKCVLTSKKELQPQVRQMVPDIFNFRMKAIGYLLDHEIEPLEAVIEVSHQFASHSDDEHIGMLVENLMFALECNSKVISEFSKNENLKLEKAKSQEIADKTYDLLINEIRILIPTHQLQDIKDWIEASIFIEFTLFATDMIIDKTIKPSIKLVEELSTLVVNASHNYISYVFDREDSLDFITDMIWEIDALPEFVKEQQRIAEQGISDWNDNLNKS